jgi:nucleotide-binding universal stress UspA family protein
LHSLLGREQDVDARLATETRSELKHVADDIAREFGLQPSQQVAVGNVVDEIVGESLDADLLVLGAHGQSGLRDMLLGSVSERVILKRERPTLVVNRPVERPYQRVLVPVALGPNSVNALRAALLFAPDADITVFNAFVLPFEATLYLAGTTDDEIDRYRQAGRANALARVEEIINAAGGGQRIRRSVEIGDAAPLILAREAETDSDLIVVGKWGEGTLDRLLGSVTRQVLSRAKADVLVVGAETGQKAMGLA